MKKEIVPPSVKETAFICPHCGAFTTQYWFTLYAEQRKENGVPVIPTPEWVTEFEQEAGVPKEVKQHWLDWAGNMMTGLVFLSDRDNTYPNHNINNLFLSKCYNCDKLAVWVHDNLVFPAEKQGVSPNQDLPDEIIQDIEEARDIVARSPRGAAALLRLSIQKLCQHLGEEGKNIDKDIASLVSKGLNPLVQKSLDIVRVIGNEAVHPGVIDLRDDRNTANNLFDLVNSIADQMITHPKKVEALYGKLPEGKRKAIENRDKKKPGK